MALGWHCLLSACSRAHLSRCRPHPCAPCWWLSAPTGKSGVQRLPQSLSPRCRCAQRHPQVFRTLPQLPLRPTWTQSPPTAPSIKASSQSGVGFFLPPDISLSPLCSPGDAPSTLCVHEFDLFVDSTCQGHHAVFVLKAWLTSLSRMSSRLIQVVTDGRASFLFPAEEHPTVCSHHRHLDAQLGLADGAPLNPGCRGLADD